MVVLPHYEDFYQLHHAFRSDSYYWKINNKFSRWFYISLKFKLNMIQLEELSQYYHTGPAGEASNYFILS